MFINGLNQDLSLLVNRTRMQWETMSILDLVNFASQLAYSLGESLGKKQKINTKILNF